MIVELVGAPGAGKSYLAPILAARCGVPVIKIGRLGQRHFYFALFAMKNWRLTRSALREFRRQERAWPELRTELKGRRFRSMGAKSAKARLIGGGLIDEGIFQGLLKIFEDAATPAEIAHWLSLIGTPPDRVFIVDAPRDERLARQHARGNVPRRDLGWEHWHASFEANIETLKPILLARYNGEVVASATA
jgi:dephospho-CoA kinase